VTSGPIAESERAPILDALRGFALLGILVSHVPGFSGYEFTTARESAALDVLGIDRSLAALAEFFVRGKFFSLFSLLFGIGFAIQLESAHRRGARFARHFTRRLAVLGAIGVAHGLLWYGDILRDYALLGLALLPSAGWDARKTLRAALALLAARLAWPLLVVAIAPWLAPLAASTAGADPAASFEAHARAFGGTSVAAMFAVNLDLLRLKALQLVYEGKALSILSMFFLGATLGKTGLHRALAARRPAIVRTLAVCAPLGVLGNALLVRLHAAVPAYPPTLAWAAEGVVFAVAVPALTLAYACGFALAFARGSRLLRAFAPAGRMALTTYVSQTLLCIALFYGIGFGLQGSLGQAGCVLVASAIFTLQSVLAAAWLRRFRFGPLEWAWRRLTYGTRVPMRRPAPLAGSATRRAQVF
jgi:uncharacterized protein